MLRQVPTLPLTLRDPQHGMFIKRQLVVLNTLDTENQPSAATFPFPSPWRHGGEGKAWADRMFTEKLSPCKVLKHSWSKCWGLMLGAAFFPAVRGLFGSHCIKPRATQLALLQLSLPWDSAQPFEKSQTIKLSTSL